MKISSDNKLKKCKVDVNGYQTLSLMKIHCKMSITKDQSLKVSCSSREVAFDIHYTFLVRNVEEVPTFCHGSCVSFNHLLVTCQGDKIACANQEKCFFAFHRCDEYTDCSDGSDEQCSKYRGG